MHFDLKKFEFIAKLVAPIVLGSVGVPPTVTQLVVNGINVAEAASADGEKTGAEKKVIAMNAVVVGLNAINEAKPGTIDVAEVMGAVDGGIDATVKAIKAAKDIPIHQPTTAPVA